jgi:TolB-like protein/DNA-binding SARP family transcriptional activator
VCDFVSAIEAADVSTASTIYTGPFLDGFYIKEAPEFEDWVETERRQLADAYASCLESAARTAVAEGEQLVAAEHWRRLINLDPYNSRAVVGLMEALSAAGDPANALLVAEEHSEFLARELGVGVPPELDELAERLRSAPRPLRRRPVVARGSSHTAPEVKPEVSRTRSPRWALPLVVLAVATTGVWLAGRLIQLGPPPPGGSVAVLPFVNLTGDPELEYLVDGVTDALIAQLSLVQGLRVPAQTSSFHFKGRAMDVRAIADSLGTDQVVEGSMRWEGANLIVTSQLIDAETGYHLWTGLFDAPPEDFLSLQGQVADSVVVAVGGHGSGQDLVGWRLAASTGAWRDYQRARHWWMKRSQMGTDSAIHYFRQAIERDSLYAVAWAGLADTYITGLYWKHLPNDSASHQTARDAARQAAALGPNLPEVILTQARVDFEERRYDAAEATVQRALRVNPNAADAHQILSEVYRKQGLQEESLAAARRAYSLDPVSPFRSAFLGNILNSNLMLEDAIVHWSYALELEPEHAGALGLKSWALLCLGRLEEARAASAQLAELRGRSDHDVQMLYYERDYVGALALVDSLRGLEGAVSYRSIGRERQRQPAPEPSLGARMAAWSHLELEQWNEAMAEYRLSANDYPGEAQTAMLLAFIYASRGESERARELLKAKHDVVDPPGYLVQSATVWAELGEIDRAVDALEEAYNGRRSTAMSSSINPRFDALRGEPRFEEFLERIGLPLSDEVPETLRPASR